MAIRSFGLALCLMVLVMLVGSVAGALTLNTDLVSYACNRQIIPSASAFFDTLYNLVVDLERNTPSNAYNYKTSSAGSPTAYGQGVCNGGLSQSDCSACLIDLSVRIGGICNNAIGAQVQLTDCFMRYEQHSF